MNLLNTLLISGLIFYFGTPTLKAQNVNIPDANFKAYLVGNTAINSNGDGEIQLSEASNFSGNIDCSLLNIADLTGIEAFVKLRTLRCHYNQLDSLDVTQNVSLTSLDCSDNSLSDLDITQNTNLSSFDCSRNSLVNIDVTQNMGLTFLDCSVNLLVDLDVTQNIDLLTLSCFRNQLSNLNLTQNSELLFFYCHWNQLSSLDLTQNPKLGWFDCYGNQLSSLDLSQNSNLVEMSCSYNQLSSLNIKNGNNVSLTNFGAMSNPNLSCIEVDDSTYSTNNWLNKDPIAIFSTNCGLFDNVTTINKEINLTAYPNPTTKEITLDFGKFYQETNIQVTNLRGQTVLNKTVENNSTTKLELEGTAGVYFIKIQTEEGTATLKVIKE